MHEHARHYKRGLEKPAPLDVWVEDRALQTLSTLQTLQTLQSRCRLLAESAGGAVVPAVCALHKTRTRILWQSRPKNCTRKLCPTNLTGASPCTALATQDTHEKSFGSCAPQKPVDKMPPKGSRLQIIAQAVAYQKHATKQTYSASSRFCQAMLQCGPRNGRLLPCLPARTVAPQQPQQCSQRRLAPQPKGIKVSLSLATRCALTGQSPLAQIKHISARYAHYA
jgi:hypothetical protein